MRHNLYRVFGRGCTRARAVSIMPIFEYSCEDCGTKFEKLVRRTAEAGELNCPSCGHAHLHQEYSTFSAQSGGAKEVQPAGGCGGSMCDTGFCGGGMCGMN